jgi:hypothetical protein
VAVRPTRRRTFDRGRDCALALALACLIAAGCKTKPYVNAHIESVNAEYRQLEDYVYALEEQNARLQQELDAARQLAATGSVRGTTTPPSSGSLFRRGPARPTPSSPPDSAAPGIEPPVIELPGVAPEGAPLRPRSTFRQSDDTGIELSAPADTPPSIELPLRSHEALPPAGDNALPAPLERLPAKPTDTKITHLFLNPAFTGGCDLDGQPGDDGLKVVLEPRNSSDEYVPEAGSLSLVVLDPEREGDAARVARWDFDLDAARQVLAQSGTSKGLALELPWPASSPSASRLHLYVRYESADGHRIQTDRDIYITPPGQAISRWTPRAAESDRSAAIQPATKLDGDR